MCYVITIKCYFLKIQPAKVQLTHVMSVLNFFLYVVMDICIQRHSN